MPLRCVFLDADTPAQGLNLPSLSIVGREWRNHGEYYVPRWVSMLYALQPARGEDQWRAFFAWAVATGFDGVRVFAGDLDQVRQTAAGARERLPRFLDIAAEYGLVVEVTAITGSVAGRYEVHHHVKEIGAICRGRNYVVVELGNELQHSSQRPEMADPNFLRGLASELRAGGFTGPAAYGAAAVDEPDEHGHYLGAGLDFSTSHLDRGRDLWNRARRVREIYSIVEGSGRPALDNENMGADELSVAGRRSNDPAEFAVHGALDRGFGIGGVHHSQAGLHAELPGPVQQACADAYVAAGRAVDAALSGESGSYRNTGSTGGPVAPYSDAVFATDIVRHYSFVRGAIGASVQIGVRPGVVVPWAGGWQPTGVVTECVGQDGRMLRVIPVARA